MLLMTRIKIAALLFLCMCGLGAQAQQLDYALLEAAADDDLKEVQELITRGAAVDARSYQGITPLMYAAQNGNLQMTRFLILSGADLNLQPYSGLTALHAAIINQHQPVASLLLRYHAATDSADNYGATPLHYAVAVGQVDLVLLLLNASADVNARDKKGYTPAAIATYANDALLLSLLRDYGARVKIPAKNGITPLAIAAAEGFTALVDSLLADDAPQQNSGRGYSALDFAVLHQQTATARQLSEMGWAPGPIKGALDTWALWRMQGSNREMKGILQSGESRRNWWPWYNELHLGTGFAWNGADVLWSFYAGVHDAKWNHRLQLNYSFRPYEKPVQVKQSAQRYRQYWETRQEISLKLNKYVALMRKETQTHQLYLALDAGYSFSHWPGTEQKPYQGWMWVPEAGYSLRGDFWQVSLGYAYADYHTLQLSPHRIFLSATGIIPIRQSFPTIEIPWLSNE